jgi:hypothetical protein
LAGAKEAAEKLIERGILSAVDLAGAEARTHLMGFIGPAEAVPLLQGKAPGCLFGQDLFSILTRMKEEALRRSRLGRG